MSPLRAQAARGNACLLQLFRLSLISLRVVANETPVEGSMVTVSRPHPTHFAEDRKHQLLEGSARQVCAAFLDNVTGRLLAEGQTALAITQRKAQSSADVREFLEQRLSPGAFSFSPSGPSGRELLLTRASVRQVQHIA